MSPDDEPQRPEEALGLLGLGDLLLGEVGGLVAGALGVGLRGEELDLHGMLEFVAPCVLDEVDEREHPPVPLVGVVGLGFVDDGGDDAKGADEQGADEGQRREGWVH